MREIVRGAGVQAWRAGEAYDALLGRTLEYQELCSPNRKEWLIDKCAGPGHDCALDSAVEHSGKVTLRPLFQIEHNAGLERSYGGEGAYFTCGRPGFNPWHPIGSPEQCKE